MADTIKSTSDTSKHGMIVLNPDGSNITGTGTSSNQVQGPVASGATNSANPVKQGLVYNATPPTVTDGQVVDQQGDVNGNAKTVEQYMDVAVDNINGVYGEAIKPHTSGNYSLITYKDAGTVTKANIKASAGNVFNFRITNTNAAVRYFQIHNKATAPAGGDTALRYFVLPAGTPTAPSIREIEFLYPTNCSTGIGWAISTTATIFTDSATASDHIVESVGYL